LKAQKHKYQSLTFKYYLIFVAGLNTDVSLA